MAARHTLRVARHEGAEEPGGRCISGPPQDPARIADLSEKAAEKIARPIASGHLLQPVGYDPAVVDRVKTGSKQRRCLKSLSRTIVQTDQPGVHPKALRREERTRLML